MLREPHDEEATSRGLPKIPSFSTLHMADVVGESLASAIDTLGLDCKHVEATLPAPPLSTGFSNEYNHTWRGLLKFAQEEISRSLLLIHCEDISSDVITSRYP